jgi:hypothetical protein
VALRGAAVALCGLALGAALWFVALRGVARRVGVLNCEP